MDETLKTRGRLYKTNMTTNELLFKFTANLQAAVPQVKSTNQAACWLRSRYVLLGKLPHAAAASALPPSAPALATSALPLPAPPAATAWRLAAKESSSGCMTCM